MSRPRTYRVQGVVLRRVDTGEADRILTLYTREQGKVRAIAKGVRRLTSRRAGHLELFSLGDMQLAVGRDLDVVQQADTVEAFRHVREDLERAAHAYYLVEILDLMTEEREEQASVFRALVDALQALDAGRDARLVQVMFLVRLLKVLGYGPEVQECVSCRADLAPGGNAFSALLGGALCPPCAGKDPAARSVGDNPLKLLRHAQGRGDTWITATPDVSREAELLLRTYAESIRERRLRSPAFIARVRQESAATRL